MKTFTHAIQDPMGLHARPAAALVKACAGFSSAVTISCGAAKADAKRLMAVMRLGAKHAAELTVSIEGPDEETATAQLKTFLANNL